MIDRVVGGSNTDSDSTLGTKIGDAAMLAVSSTLSALFGGGRRRGR